MTALLEAKNVTMRFGGVTAVQSVNLTLREVELRCLIGPNGAGKSTLFRLILGEYTPSAGRILYAGNDITALPAYARIRRGISVKFQVPGVFPALTVRHNLVIALQHHLQGLSLQEEVDRLLRFLNLHDTAGQQAGSLSHGQKQWLEIGMAVAVKPRLLLLDEPTAGMSPEETRATGDMVHALNADGVTVLAVEHDMSFVRHVAARVTVLHMGKIFAQGTIAEMEADEQVAAIYLGEGHSHG
jgi:branched-chain amino acid transport system ATP-binding protein